MSQSTRVCAVRMPGSSQASFADAGGVQIELEQWVVVQSAAGEEAARIVVEPDQWICTPAIKDLLPIVRTLTDEELETLAIQMQCAIELVNPVSDLLRESAPGAFLAGLRFNLAGDCLIVTLLGPAPAERESLTSAISNVARNNVSLEVQKSGGPQGLLGGGVGKISGKRPQTFRELLRQRVEMLASPATFAPQGVPRLGSMVRTSQGTGTLARVDIRHGIAGVQLLDGSTIEVQLDKLEDPDDSA